ncbi:recombinase family protein [Psychromarinibacter halotolerans]|uniref:Recombinase family protein n=1 Tax=Psychromarinibacter halotolerans TaxID=1775175 RepID=A0ABV7GSK4_9RHOB|nr:recombinase family protein [Psychromarinibacter halotolerans]MDF0596900.1 recombinase family protein [Psychromarinibacter halotolerans]
MNRTRCAIYTRKSSEDGLEQEFNSLHAQREACAAYIVSQKHEGWVALPEHYDDGGLSGGSLERPALQQLLEDTRQGRVDQIVVYKIDRLTRSLADFAKIVDILDAAGASFVSVTQSFNTATSMGRLTLNMLLSFAQFEREVTAERIRDKIAASKRKGLWMGGLVPLGYQADGRTLAIDEGEAETIQQIYDLYEKHGTVVAVRDAASDLGLRSRLRSKAGGKNTGGRPLDRGHIHHILTNPLYAGRIRHRTQVYDGAHPAIIDPARWDHIQTLLQQASARPRGQGKAARTSLLCGKVFDETGDRLTPSHSKTRAGTRLRYYISNRLVVGRAEQHPDAWRLPAEELERHVAELVGRMLAEPSLPARILVQPTADAICMLAAGLDALKAERNAAALLELVSRVEIAPATLQLALETAAIASRLGNDVEAMCPDLLKRSFPFQLRKRGVETRIILADAPLETDDRLICNIARAQSWFDRVRAGETFDEIAKNSDTSKRRIQQMIGLAFLAPDIIRMVMDGNQPAGFTSDWFKRNNLPPDWHEQRAIVAAL